MASSTACGLAAHTSIAVEGGCATRTSGTQHGREQLAWVLLIVAGLLEIVWATALSYAQGFTRFWPSVVGLVSAALSFVLLALALRSLPVGTAYAIWVGIGAGGVAAFGMLYLGEPASPLRIACLMLILAGTIGLKLVET